MLLLGAFVFMRQYFQDQALIALLNESRRGYESQKRLQNQLVQKEKLASLGNLVAGAANEINHPLTAIISYSEQLWAKEHLTDEQNQLLRKIVNQSRRTRDLVTDLLRFAQQSPGEKIPVDLSVLLHRATQMLELRRPGGKIRVSSSIAPNFPRVHGNANQLFQAFVEIIENAMDALEEAGGGSLEIVALRLGEDAMLQFSDTGPGIRDPLLVFDPFYTTKPVGKGTGLGLSAVCGVIQDHNGQITCRTSRKAAHLHHQTSRSSRACRSGRRRREQTRPPLVRPTLPFAVLSISDIPASCYHKLRCPCDVYVSSTIRRACSSSNLCANSCADTPLRL